MTKYTKTQIRAILLESAKHMEGHPEYGLYTRADSMTNGGSHHWYIGKGGENDVRCLGRGPGWYDQDDDCAYTLDEAVDHIYKDLRIIDMEDEG